MLVNGGRAKSARLVKPADKLQISHSRGEYQITIRSIPERRGPMLEAENCFVVDEFAEASPRQRFSRRDEAHPAASVRRLDKQARRKLRALKGRG